MTSLTRSWAERMATTDLSPNNEGDVIRVSSPRSSFAPGRSCTSAVGSAALTAAITSLTARSASNSSSPRIRITGAGSIAAMSRACHVSATGSQPSSRSQSECRRGEAVL